MKPFPLNGAEETLLFVFVKTVITFKNPQTNYIMFITFFLSITLISKQKCWCFLNENTSTRETWLLLDIPSLELNATSFSIEIS